MAKSRKPKILCLDAGTLARYKDRVVRVKGEARGQRSMIEWVAHDGTHQRSTVKWKSLAPLEDQLF
ncbi:hypothetical protein [Pararobbsia alpina]|uniref:Uncharacterized protein n=1 Tax=Pararobbsia alpina TaxID=621374 RepID=A0A6S7BPP7_9BURK|nr:hypothetical protein [Pararobbsia alpina]CAB3795343.1 hypothetical protein LMG28138_03862 [Pararobbsia alpina]